MRGFIATGVATIGSCPSRLLAPRARWRAAVFASAGSEWSEGAAAACLVADDERCASEGRGRPRGYLWAELMRRTFEIDVLDCPRCGGRLRLLALIEDARIVERILRHLGLPNRPARAAARSCSTAVGAPPASPSPTCNSPTCASNGTGFTATGTTLFIARQHAQLRQLFPDGP